MARFSIAEILKESRRRRVFRVAALYIVGSWVVLQVADMAFPALDIPETSIRHVWIGVIIGFPIALVLGWRYQIIDGRVFRTRSAGDDIELSLQRTDYAILTALFVVTIFVTVGLIREISEGQVSFDGLQVAEDIDSSSIAVLPFVNMSPDPNNAYFGDGIAEELLNRLSKVKELRVIARTSTFSLRDKDLSTRQISRQLKAAFILEGSVRVSGDNLRITAQLIDGRSDSHRWSETYDRPMGEIFSIQDDVTQRVVDALKKELVVSATAQSDAGTENIEAYTLFLEARSIYDRISLDIPSYRADLERTIRILEEAISLDDNYGDAHILLARSFNRLESYYSGPGTVDDQRAGEAREAKNQVVAALRQLTDQPPRIQRSLRQLDASIHDQVEIYRQALEENPNDVEALSMLGHLLITDGSREEGATLIRQAQILDPLSPQRAIRVSRVASMEGKLKESSDYQQLSNALRGPIASDLADSDASSTPSEQAPIRPTNLDLESDNMGWRLRSDCGDEFEFSRSSEAHAGNWSGLLTSSSRPGVWCHVFQIVAADRYRQKFVRFSGMYRTSPETDFAKIWLTAWGENFAVSFADGYPDIAISNSDWMLREVRIYVPENAETMTFGAIVTGNSSLWMDDLSFEVSDTPDFTNPYTFDEAN